MADIFTITPTTGAGNSSLAVSATQHTGRESRSITYYASGTGSYSSVTGSNNLTVIQNGQAFISLENKEISDSATTVTINGEANLATLKVSGSLSQYLTSATIAGAAASVSDLKSVAGYTVPNDPGASAKYTIVLNFTELPTSTGSFSLTMGDGTNSDTASISRESAPQVDAIWFSNGESSFVRTDDISITLNADGSITSGSDPRINTTSTGLSWTINVNS